MLSILYEFLSNNGKWFFTSIAISIFLWYYYSLENNTLRKVCAILFTTIAIISNIIFFAQAYDIQKNKTAYYNDVLYKVNLV